jgi:hypothetical protein
MTAPPLWVLELRRVEDKVIEEMNKPDEYWAL